MLLGGLIGVFVLAVGSGEASDLNPHRHQIPLTNETVAVDGVLEEAMWDDAWVYELGFEVQPGENTPAIVRTEVLVTYDNRHLLIGIRAYDPEPEKIRAHLADRDQAWADDWAGVVLDTFNDERRNYLLLVNPYGVQMDEIEAWPNGGTVWDGIWDSAGTITEWGWSAELKIPFSTLRFQRSDGPQVWGFDAIRGYPRNIQRQFGAFARDRDNNCYLCQAIKIEGFKGISPGKNLEIVPTLTASQTESRSDFPDGDLESGSIDTEIGGTVRWGFTPNLTLSAAINPDFSQVEADALQLRVNEPFALFFPEKRPFFMEGADFFSTSFNAVYTRVMRDPAWGVKVTGKEGPHTIGAYVVEDDVTNVIFPGSQSSSGTTLDSGTDDAVGRYKLDIQNRHTLGLIMTSRSGPDYENRVGGFDGDFRLSDKDRLIVQALYSKTRYPDEIAADYEQPEGSFSDWAGEISYYHDTRTWSTWAEYMDIGKGFRADLGFMPRVDVRKAEVGGTYLWTGNADDWYTKLLLIGKVLYEEDHDGNLLDEEWAVRFNYEGPLQIHAYIRPSTGREGFNGEVFDRSELSAHVCLKPNRSSHVFFNITAGDQIDYANTRPGERFNVNPGFWYRFGKHLRVEASYLHETLDVDQGELYSAAIARLNASYQFNARTFFRAILQHVDYEFNTELYGDDRDAQHERLVSQLLFSYKVNPQTVFFLGYTDNSLANQDHTLTVADRTVFAKVGYAFVF